MKVHLAPKERALTVRLSGLMLHRSDTPTQDAGAGEAGREGTTCRPVASLGPPVDRLVETGVAADHADLARLPEVYTSNG